MIIGVEKDFNIETQGYDWVLHDMRDGRYLKTCKMGDLEKTVLDYLQNALYSQLEGHTEV
jgi:hypothetical protein